MNNMSVQKVQIRFSIFALVIASLACNYKNRDAVEVIAEAAMEHCFTVGRSQYESSADQLGQTPETPKYPESAVYEVCQINGQPSSIRMTDGNKPEDNEQTESEGKSEPAPAGMYIGDNLDVPSGWELVEDEFIIMVAENGTVSGSRIYIIKKETVGTTCTWRWENGHTTIISGHISGTNGYVTVENESYTISDDSDCDGSNNHKTFESVCDNAQISVSGEQMEIYGDGSNDCGFVYTATKQ